MMKNLKALLDIILLEIKAIGTSIPILIVYVLGNVGYGFLYNIMYGPNELNNAPIAVVDNSKTKLSQQLIHYMDATPQVSIYTTIPDFKTAEELLKRREVIGIIYIPEDFQEKIQAGQQTTCTLYGSTLSFIDYLNANEALTFAALNVNSELLPAMVQMLPLTDVLSLVNIEPVNIVGNVLYNSTGGYGTYLIPPVLMIIIFQTLMIGVSMMAGMERERKKLNAEVYLLGNRHPEWMIVLGKAFANVAIYVAISTFLIGLLPILFHLPHIANGFNILIMMIPYLFASVFFCLCFARFYTDGDMPLLFIVFMSVPLVFLSGISYPLELMPWYWKIAHYLIPSGPATLAFVKMNCMGADLVQAQEEMITLWIQCGFYFLLSCLLYRNNLKKNFGFVISKHRNRNLATDIR